MLRPIRKTECTAALSATQNMILNFALWLCRPNISGSSITKIELRKLLKTSNESDWLWAFLQGKHKTKPHLNRAQYIADLDSDTKEKLKDWIIATTNIRVYFSSIPNHAKIPVEKPFARQENGDNHWSNLKELMEAFYLKGLNEGLAYLPDGTPTAEKKQASNYQTFRSNFIKAHQLDAHEYARQVCVICSGELHNPSVDHWIAKADFPLLSVCADNLVPICGECNQSPNKGTKEVHTDGSFDDWYHPYLRHPNGSLHISYDSTIFGVKLESCRPSDKEKASNLNQLFNLEERWTREFKSEYRKLFNSIIMRQKKRGTHLTLEELLNQLDNWADGLSPEQPHFEVHQALAATLHDAERLIVWHGELLNDL